VGGSGQWPSGPRGRASSWATFPSSPDGEQEVASSYFQDDFLVKDPFWAFFKGHQRSTLLNRIRFFRSDLNQFNGLEVYQKAGSHIWDWFILKKEESSPIPRTQAFWDLDSTWAADHHRRAANSVRRLPSPRDSLVQCMTQPFPSKQLQFRGPDRIGREGGVGFAPIGWAPDRLRQLLVFEAPDGRCDSNSPWISSSTGSYFVLGSISCWTWKTWTKQSERDALLENEINK
jgi:hypothetical protein